MATINNHVIMQSIARSDRGWSRINTICDRRFEDAKEEMLKEFDASEITLELKAGESSPESASNLSNTLGGKGNLFSFIGFPAGSTPSTDLRDSLDRNVTKNTPKLTPRFDAIEVEFSVKVNNTAIAKETPLPFEKGQSWAFGIERGISGFSRFLAGFFKASRSGGGVQARHEVRAAEFQEKPYITPLLSAMIQRMRGK